MTGIRQDFFNYYSQSENEERKRNVTSSKLTPISNQGSSQQQLNKTQKDIHLAMIPTQEKLRKQMKSVLHQEVSDFNPSDQTSMEQIDFLYNYQREQFNQTSSQIQKMQKKQQMENILQSQKANPANKTQENILQKLKNENHKLSKSQEKEQRKNVITEIAKIMYQNYPKVQKLQKILNLRKRRENSFIATKTERFTEDTRNQKQLIKERNKVRYFNQEISYYQTHFKGQ